MLDADQDATSVWDRQAASLSADPASAGIAARLAALPPRPGPDGDTARWSVVQYIFIWLVNYRHYQLANEVVAQLGLRNWLTSKTDNGMKLSVPADFDIMFCLAVLDTQPGGDPKRARADFAALREMLPSGHHLLPSCDEGEVVAIRCALLDAAASPDIVGQLAALGPLPGLHGQAARSALIQDVFTSLVNREDYKLAAEVANRLGLRSLIETKTASGAKLTDPHDLDTMFGLAVLDTLPGGDAIRAGADFAALRAMLPDGHHLHQSCDSGEISAIRATFLGQSSSPDIAARLLALPPLPGPNGDAARRVLIQDVFIKLVNQRDYNLASIVAQQHGLRSLIETKIAADVKLAQPYDLDTLFGLAVLDTQPGGNLERALADFEALRRMLPARHHLHQSCDSGELNAVRASFLRQSSSPDIATRLSALPPLPGPDGEAARQVLIQDVFIKLVNQRDYGLAITLAQQFGLRSLMQTKIASPAQLTDPHDFDTIYALAVLDTQRGGNPERARADFVALRALLPPGHPLIKSCDAGEEVAIRLAAHRTQTVIEAAPGGVLAKLGLARDAKPVPRKITFADFTINPEQNRLPWLDRDDVDESRLTASQSAWRRDGVLILRNFLPAREVDAYVARRAQLENPAGWMSPTPYQHVPEMRALALYPPLMAMQKHLLGDDMMLHLALTGWISTERDWHQDDYLNPAFVMTRYTAIWMALDDISPDAGPFEYVPGSHRWPLISGDKVRKLLNADEQGLNNWESRAERFMTPAIEAEIAARSVKPVQFIGHKGDVLIWHARLMHRGTPPRRTSLERRSLIVHYSSVNHRPDMPNRATENGETYALFDRPLY